MSDCGDPNCSCNINRVLELEGRIENVLHENHRLDLVVKEARKMLEWLDNKPKLTFTPSNGLRQALEKLNGK